jgi:hypothetical protein
MWSFLFIVLAGGVPEGAPGESLRVGVEAPVMEMVTRRKAVHPGPGAWAPVRRHDRMARRRRVSRLFRITVCVRPPRLVRTSREAERLLVANEVAQRVRRAGVVARFVAHRALQRHAHLRVGPNDVRPPAA